MAALVFIVPVVYFGVIGLVFVGLFGAAIPWLAGHEWLTWVGSSWFTALLKLSLLILGVAMPVASVLTWMERRQSALAQDRLGPNRARIGNVRAFGLLHFLADALKMLFKEDFIPAKANRFLFALAPILAIAPVFIVLAIVPFGSPLCPGHLTDHLSDEALAACLADPAGNPFATRLQVAHLEVGMLFYFAIASIAVYGATLAGWASYNKWSLLGGLRASSQMMSYEVTMGMAILGTFLVCGSLEPGRIVEWQGTTPFTWGIVTQPLGFLLFMTAAIAETKRTPFDLPEGEPEVIGYFVEYSGLRFGMFYLAEFLEVTFVAAIVTTMFLGGWQFPGLHADGQLVPFIGFVGLPHWLVTVLHTVVFGFKTFVMCWFQLMVRWTLPRLRPDQLMALGWKGLLPISIANILVTAGVVLAISAMGAN